MHWRIATMIARYEYHIDHAGEWRWTAIAGNGEAIGSSSEGYKNIVACLHAIDLMQGSRSAAVVPRVIDLNSRGRSEPGLARILARLSRTRR
jgi:uncharacterized protein YegP (UPF0339 family)